MTLSQIIHNDIFDTIKFLFEVLAFGFLVRHMFHLNEHVESLEKCENEIKKELDIFVITIKNYINDDKLIDVRIMKALENIEKCDLINKPSNDKKRFQLSFKKKN